MQLFSADLVVGAPLLGLPVQLTDSFFWNAAGFAAASIFRSLLCCAT
jgi:hypothetical protein